jgi:protein-S-isoprenylcysteine O-methyltransferase Ste14
MENEEICYSWYANRGRILVLPMLALLALNASLNSVQIVVVFVLFAVGLLLRIEVRRSLGMHSRGSEPQAPELLTLGWYSKSRNPLYIANVLQILSLAIWRAGWWGLVVLPPVIWFYNKVIAEEESYLRRRFAKDYEHWSAQVNRWWSWGAKWKEGEAEESEQGERIVLRKTPWVQVVREDFWSWFWQVLVLVLYGLLPAVWSI